MIKPTIGRQVWYWPEQQVSQPYAATICHVWTDTCVNLSILDANGKQFAETSVLLYQGDENSDRPAGKFAEWMPYQKGQAKKTEELEQKLPA
ncbi:MAG: hypothetical protein OEX19_16025 [Gammaproteobacteria bacterium]|nr:hypothetical protein [Gammaproteobacteria bacterium]